MLKGILVSFALLATFAFFASFAPELKKSSKSREETLELQISKLEEKNKRMEDCFSSTYRSVEDSMYSIELFMDGDGYGNIEDAWSYLNESCVLKGY